MTIPIKYEIDKGARSQIRALWTVLIIACVLLALFGGLALRNAKTLVCDEIGTDTFGQKYCKIRIKELKAE